MGYKSDQYERVKKLIKNNCVFYGDAGNGLFRKKQHPFILKDRNNNFYSKIRCEAIEYFADNNISWWGGRVPTNHPLSSQIACVNHLFPIRQDEEAVLAIAKTVHPEVKGVVKIASDDVNTGFIQFEAVSKGDNLNEMEGRPLIRGSQCTSIDALILGQIDARKQILIVIEWKYTEAYGNENKAAGEKGETRKSRYDDLIKSSAQLKADAQGVYYYEPFYQLMRQTLWAEQMIKNKASEIIKADDYIHVHVIPPENGDLLRKTYKCSQKDMESTWRGCLNDEKKYKIISPADFLSPIDQVKYKELVNYLETRYWEDI